MNFLSVYQIHRQRSDKQKLLVGWMSEWWMVSNIGWGDQLVDSESAVWVLTLCCLSLVPCGLGREVLLDSLGDGVEISGAPFNLSLTEEGPWADLVISFSLISWPLDPWLCFLLEPGQSRVSKLFSHLYFSWPVRQWNPNGPRVGKNKIRSAVGWETKGKLNISLLVLFRPLAAFAPTWQMSSKGRWFLIRDV